MTLRGFRVCQNHLRQRVGQVFTDERFPIINEPHPLTQVVLTRPPEEPTR